MQLLKKLMRSFFLYFLILCINEGRKHKLSANSKYLLYYLKSLFDQFVINRCLIILMSSFSH